jgi:putative transposase
VIFAWMREHAACWPVSVMCEVLKVSRSGYYAWIDRPPSAREEQTMKLIKQIRAAHEQSRRTYGSPRLTVDLNEAGVSVCENTVARLMRQAGIKAKARRRYVPRTTDSAHAHPIAPNHLDRDFTADAPNRKWTCDISYVPTEQGWLYLAAVMDVFSRRIVGWSMRDHLKGELVSEALQMALRNRRPGAGLLHHSDRGVQYACADYRRLLEEHGIECSMSRRGNCYDNAVMESFFSTFKSELVHPEQYATHAQARASIFEWIEVFYNRRRRHSSLGYLSPEAFEAKLN